MSLKIVVPDDFPAAFTGSAAEPRLRGLGRSPCTPSGGRIRKRS